MARQKITCCFNCPDRTPGCHGYCDKYKQQRAEYDATKAEYDKQKAIEIGLDTFLYGSTRRTARKKNYRDNKRKVP